MRQLTSKQKKLLRKWYKENEPSEKEKMLYGKMNPITTCDDLTEEQWDTLVKINDTEILWSNVNQFLWDLR